MTCIMNKIYQKLDYNTMVTFHESKNRIESFKTFVLLFKDCLVSYVLDTDELFRLIS